jgi:hypothetical protein
MRAAAQQSWTSRWLNAQHADHCVSAIKCLRSCALVRVGYNREHIATWAEQFQPEHTMLQQKHKAVYRLSPSCMKLLPRKSGHLSTPPGVSACIVHLYPPPATPLPAPKQHTSHCPQVKDSNMQASNFEGAQMRTPWVTEPVCLLMADHV